jgi:glycerophosphoryl diester phosphodiesterase
LSSDSKFICYHDDNLRKIGIDKRIRDIPLKELISIELVDGITIPSLEEILERFGKRTLLNIELKPRDKGVKELVELINQFSIKKKPSNLIVSSFSSTQLQKIKSHDPEIPTGFLFLSPVNKVKLVHKMSFDAIHPFYNSTIDVFVKIPIRIISPIFKYYTDKCFKEANEYKLLINPWTVNDEYFLNKCFEKQFFSVITDAVDQAIEIRKKYS